MTAKLWEMANEYLYKKVYHLYDILNFQDSWIIQIGCVTTTFEISSVIVKNVIWLVKLMRNFQQPKQIQIKDSNFVLKVCMPMA